MTTAEIRELVSKFPGLDWKPHGDNIIGLFWEGSPKTYVYSMMAFGVPGYMHLEDFIRNILSSREYSNEAVVNQTASEEVEPTTLDDLLAQLKKDPCKPPQDFSDVFHLKGPIEYKVALTKSLLDLLEKHEEAMKLYDNQVYEIGGHNLKVHSKIKEHIMLASGLNYLNGLNLGEKYDLYYLIKSWNDEDGYSHQSCLDRLTEMVSMLKKSLS